MTEETGWLIEHEVGGQIQYVCLNRSGSTYDWTPDSIEALRFARQRDAEAFRAYLMGGVGKIADHMWTD